MDGRLVGSLAIYILVIGFIGGHDSSGHKAAPDSTKPLQR
jgi:hypothetical protein